MVGYSAALEHLKKRGGELGFPDIAALHYDALRKRVARGSIPFYRRKGTRVVMFVLSELDAWLTGGAAVQIAEAEAA
jgi:hypothetical protein